MPLLLILFFFAQSCEKEMARMDDFFLEFATVDRNSDDLFFVLDNQRRLTPISLPGFSAESGQRVVINFTPIKGDSVKVNSVAGIFTGEIKKSNNINDSLVVDPVKIQSVWVGGNYLNLIFEFEYYESDHTIGLIRDETANETDLNLYFFHSKNDDKPGYFRKTYASFLLTSLASDDGAPIKFTFHINTLTGVNTYSLEYKPYL